MIKCAVGVPNCRKAKKRRQTNLFTYQ